MANLNNANLLGRLVADPEIRATPTGKQVAKFTIAVDKRGKDAGANFFDCVAWEQRAEYLGKYGAKGAQILVSGRLDQQTWEKDGKKNSRIIIVADEVQLLSSVKQQEGKTGSETSTEDVVIDPADIPF